ncbi:MAG: hypothetical protein NT154_25325 [Verrucomicrobia bacterium]|nr:hypothetical protein [Verrucomicrobiota bacterium]
MAEMRTPGALTRHPHLVHNETSHIHPSHLNLDGQDQELRSLAYTLRTKTVALLEEYFQGRRAQVQKALGAALYATSAGPGEAAEGEEE